MMGKHARERTDAVTTSATMRQLGVALADRYRVERELGAGGMATVYLAHDLKHDRDVAIKVMSPEIAQTLGAERFLREIQLAAKLSHPHILALFDSGEADGALYYVMPRVEGQSVRDRLEAGGPLPVEEAVRIASEVAGALDYAHRHDVVHRDIKPENILLHEGHAVVADFGIGKAIAAASASATFTQLGVAIGTPAYMSPEQAAGDAIDGRSDLFALGCTLYEMLTGEPPFTGPSVQAVIAKRFHHVPPAISTTRATVPMAVSRTVEKLLEKVPHDRFTSGAHVVRALRGDADAVPAERREGPSIAVLPFTNMSADADNEFFSDGITDDITGALTRVKGLKVAARASAFAFKGRESELATIAEQLRVRHVLSGSVRRAGARVRVTAQLTDVKGGAQEWSEKYDRNLDDIFAIQDEIARSIVGELEGVLGLKVASALVERPTQDIAAYELFLRGRESVRRRSPSAVHTGLEHFQRALARDPRFVAAWQGLAEAQAALGVYGYEPMMACRARADEALAQMKALGAQPGDLALCRGMTSLYLGRDWPSMGADVAIAVEQNGGSSLAHVVAGLWHGAMGNAAPRTAAVSRLLASDPLSPWAQTMAGHCYYFTADYAEALACHNAALALDANTLNALWGSGLVLCHMGRTREAIERMRRAVAAGERGPTTVALLSYVLFIAGELDEARALGDEVSHIQMNHAYWELLFEVRSGDDDRLEAALSRAVERQAGCVSLGTTVLPDLLQLLDHPRHGPRVRQLSVFAHLAGAPVGRSGA